MNESCCNPAGECQTAPNHAQRAAAPSLRPNVDIVSAGDEVLLYADLPGVYLDGIELQFERGVIELRARAATRSTQRRALRQEFAVGDFQRSFHLAEELDGSKATAEFRDGVLCVRVPKAVQARAHRVPVSSPHA